MNPLLALSVGAVAVVLGLLVVRAGQGRIGWLLVAHGLSFVALMTSSGQSSGGIGLMLDQLASGAWVFLFLWLAVIAYLLPQGHTASRFWHRWLVTCLVGVGLFLVGAAGDVEGFRDAHAGASPPVPWLPAPVVGILGLIGLAAVVGLLVGSAVAVGARLRQASGESRLRLLWLVWGATSLPLALLLVWAGYFAFHDNTLVMNSALLLAGLALPVTIGIAILRHRLFDIEVVLSRTLVYGVLVIGVVATYALVLFAAEHAGGDGTVGGLVAVGIVAVAGHPAYALARRRIERWVYGYRHDPVQAMRRLGAELETADPLRVVDTLTGSIAQAVKVDRVWVDHEPVDRADPPGGPIERFPLVHRGQRLGDVVVEVPAGRRLTAADRALLEDLSRQAAVTVRAAQLAAELQTARARTVTAREEERKRLRRDLHHGLGPSLAAIALKVQAAQHRRDELTRNAILDEALVDTRAAISEIRQVVDDLRPPALDEVGLVAAIKQRAASLSTPTLTFDVHGPDPLPPLPAAVEVAAFRIATEAMNNVTRHSAATRCEVVVRVAGRLSVTVADNGRGGALPTAGGVGLASMAERAAELGGTCSIAEQDAGGTLVRAMIPMPDHAPMDVVA